MDRAQAYLKSLDDHRSVWLKGEKVRVLEHEAFQGAIRQVCELFQMLDHPEYRKIVGYPSPVTGETVHLSFLVPTSREDLCKRREAFQIWCDWTDGMMSRLSDYARSRLTGWYAGRKNISKYERDFSEKIWKYYDKCRDENRFVTIVQRDVQIDRSRQYQEDYFESSGILRIVKKTEDGVYVSGAKMIATSAPYTNDFLIFPVMKLSDRQRSAANLFVVPAGSQGLHIVCRESFAKPLDEEQDFPLSSRYDEMDALLIFDDVLIPWEYVLICENPEAVWELKRNLHSVSLGYHQAIIRLHAKLEFIAGLACKIVEAVGSGHFLHVQDQLGELIGQMETIKALIVASEAEGELTEEGVYLPRYRYIETAKNLGTAFYPRAIEILQMLAAGGLIQVPASVTDFQSEISPLLQTYFRGSNLGAEARTRLFKLAWDLIGTPFASRHELYERFYSGDPIRNRAAQYLSCDKSKLMSKIDKYL